MTSVLILGNGYIGQTLKARFPGSVHTHRSVEKARQTNGIHFDLNNRQSWANLPNPDTVIWTFPAQPLDLVEAFYHENLAQCPNLLVYASTSCYQVDIQDAIVTENSELDVSKPRVSGEEFLRQQGAAILVLSGIFGPQREPIEWLRKGRIKHFNKIVNLIHRDDIADITFYLLENQLTPFGERLNLTNGQYHRWSDIADNYGMEYSAITNNTSLSKSVSNAALCRLLGKNFTFRDLW